MKKKPILTAVAVCLTVALVVLTFLSRTIMTKNQVEVMYVKPRRTDILTSRDINGIAEYEKTYEAVYDIPLKIIDVFVVPGESVNANKVLMEVDARELALELKKKELAVMQLKNAGIDGRLQELQLEIAEEDVELFKEKYPTDGKIRAKSAGTVYSVNAAAGETMEPGMSLASISGKNSAAGAVFYLTVSDAAFFGVGDAAILYYCDTLYFDDNEQVMETAKNSSVSAKRFAPKDNLYRFYVPIQSEYVYHGQQVQCKISNRSPIYDFVLPFEALHRGQDDRYFVYVLKKRDGLFGEEYYPEAANVSVFFENGVSAAVSGTNISQFDDIVVWASGYLVPGDIVRVLN